MKDHKRIYKAIIDELSSGDKPRTELVEGALLRISGSGEYTSELRGDVGAVINEMEDSGVLKIIKDRYMLSASRPIALRAESCEREIIRLLRDGPLPKSAIRSRLEKHFGTDRTATLKDDQILHSLIGHVLKRLCSLGVLSQCGDSYSIAPEKAAALDDISEYVSLKADFLMRLHAKGGEFFEHYIMTLLAKYVSKYGKTVTECHTVGGSADGGIDGILKTVDMLGFRETIMVQAKNRTEYTSETTVRGFYGAVCAAQGSRGIFATTSDFHVTARAFLDGIDNCVGISGEDIFRMALECLYGFKRYKGKYVINKRIL